MGAFAQKGGLFLSNRTVSSPSFSVLYRDAGDILSRRGSRILLVEAWCVGLILVPLYMLLFEACMLLPVPLFGMFDGVLLFWIGAVLLTLLLTLPYFSGILGLACALTRGEDAVLADVFAPFSSFRSYGKALWISFGIFWKLWLIFDLATGICYLTATHAPGNILAAILAALLVICEVLLGFVLCLFRFPYLYAAICDDEGWHAARKKAKRMARACPTGGVMFFLCYVPRIVLGVLTVGILLLADVLPRMCVSYFRYCEMINESMTQSEEEINE